MRKAHSFIKGLLMVIILIPGMAGKSTAQQKVQFTQYMFNPLVINPAYAGANDALSLTFIQRSQWAGVENAPTTQTISGHTLFKKKHVGLGMTIINDKIGVHKNLNALVSYSYRIATGPRSHLSLGLQGGIHNTRSDYTSLAPNGNGDPMLNVFISQTFLDVGAGIYFKSEKFEAGLSAPGLIPENVSVNDTLTLSLSRANVFLFSKYHFILNENVAIEPSALLKYFDGVPLSYDINLNLIYRKVLTFGLSYRRRESIDFLLKAQITSQLELGYSYDYPIGSLARLSNGSHEVMIHYLFRYVKKNIRSPR